MSAAGTALTIVFTALAAARHLQNRTGLSIRSSSRPHEPLREVTITVAGQTITAQPQVPTDVQELIDRVAH
jgi:hypothetical protein